MYKLKYKLKTNKMKTQLENYEIDLLIDLLKRDTKEFSKELFDNPKEVWEMLIIILEKLELQKIDLQTK